MKKMLVVLGLAAFSVCMGQWIEGYIPIPDSFGNANLPGIVEYNPTNNKVYVAVARDGGGRYGDILVVDGHTNQRSGRAGPRKVRVAAMCHVPVVNKLYCAVTYPFWGSVLAIDGATDQELAQIPFREPRALAYNPVNERLYCGSYDDGVVVVDVHGDTVLGEIDIRGAVRYPTMAHNPANNKLYVPGYWENVGVIDASADSLIAWVELDTDTGAVCYNPANNTVYCSAAYGIAVLDGEADVFVDSVPIGRDALPLAYNPRNRQVYCSQGSRLYAVDAASNEVLDTLRFEDHVMDLVVDTAENLVFVAFASDTIRIIDGATNQVVAEIATGDELYGGCDMCLNAVEHTANTVTWFDSELLVVGGEPGTLRARVNTGDFFLPGCYNTVRDKVYGYDCDRGDIIILDGAQNRLLDRVRGAYYGCDMAYVPDQDKLYCSFSWAAEIWVVDGATDSVIARVEGVGTHAQLLYNAGKSKLYCAAASSVVAIDCLADTVVAQIPGVSGSMCLDSLGNELYCTYSERTGVDTGGVAVIDCRADTILTTIPVGTRRPGWLCHDPANSRVYGTVPGEVVVIDCRTKTLRDTIPMPSAPGRLVCNPAENRVYTAVGSVLVVIDASADTVLTILPMGDSASGPANMVLDTDGNRLFVDPSVDHVADLVVVDCAADSIVARVEPEYPFYGFVWNPRHSRLYLGTYEEGRIGVIKFPVGIAEEGKRTGVVVTGPTIVRSVLRIGDLGPKTEDRAGLLDVAGRRVMELQPGENDIRHLAPGVYFLRTAESGKRSAVTKVVIQR
jgi:DNA-binding beta-propeller fold protein YncE